MHSESERWLGTTLKRFHLSRAPQELGQAASPMKESGFAAD